MAIRRLFLLITLLIGILSNSVFASDVITLAADSEFSGFSGTLILYHENQNQYYVYNSEQATKPLTPCSTFKIYNSLIGLETGVLDKDDSKTLMVWDGTDYAYKSWNQDQTLASATRDSVVWYYQKLAAKIGLERMQTYLDSFNYGNRDISGGITRFWLHSSLKISAFEQVRLLQAMFSGDLGVNTGNVEIVKRNITQVKSDKLSYYGKTGSAYVEGKWIVGWWVGAVEKDGERYFFATNIEGDDNANGGKARQITESVLRKLNIFE